MGRNTKRGSNAPETEVKRSLKLRAADVHYSPMPARTNNRKIRKLKGVSTAPAVRDDSSTSALAALRDLIGEHSSMPDKPLPTERDLSTRFRVSRRAVRQALAVLEAEGRIWRRQGKGTFVGPMGSMSPSSLGLSRLSNRTNFFEVMEVRRYIEPILVQLAAVRASEAQVTMMRRLAAQADAGADDGNADVIELWDGAFHRSIAEAAGNRLFLDLFEVVDAIRRDAAWGAYRDKARTADRLKVYARQHLAIVDAIARRAPADAAKTMREHIQSLQSALVAVVDEDVGNAV